MIYVTLKEMMYELDQALEEHVYDPDLTGMEAPVGRGYVSALRRAYREIYETPFVWPESQQGKTVALTSGKFTRADIANSDVWQVFTADPRPAGSRATKLETRRDADGIWPVTTLGSVFVLYRTGAPKLVYLPVEDEDYATGKVVYDPVTGDCYEAIADDAPGDTLTDEKWQRAWLLNVLFEPVTLLAAGHIQEGKGNTERAQRLYDRSRAKREVEFAKAFDSSRS